MRIKQYIGYASQIWRETEDEGILLRLTILKQRTMLFLSWRASNLKWRTSYLVRHILNIPARIFRFISYRISNLSWRIRVCPSYVLSPVIRFSYAFASKYFFIVMYPVNYVLSSWRRNIKYDNSVLHISYMVHIPFYATRILRKHGMKADYLAVGGESPWWNKYDYHFPSVWPPMPWHEFLFFWQVVAKYEVIHAHFGITLSNYSFPGWELPWLKRLGRKLVIHYRGCEVRDPQKNVALHPDVNICQACDYKASVCREGKKRVELTRPYGNAFLVTTPDMRDFVPEAVHFPFFTPEIDYEKYKANGHHYAFGDVLKIVHVTNHPGIEGTEQIQRVIESLKSKDYKINFVFLRGVKPDVALSEYRDADLSIGKMKMGCYANAQIESMFLGVPAITYVRPEFMTPELENSGFIFTHINDLEKTLEFYLNHPDELEKKRKIARSSILRLHNNDELAERLMAIYKKEAVV